MENTNACQLLINMQEERRSNCIDSDIAKEFFNAINIFNLKQRRLTDEISFT